MLNISLEQKLKNTLRLAVAMCFIGHGAFGIITKPIWCNYFAVFGIGHVWAYRLMPLVGVVDILTGLGMLLYPVRAIVWWLVVWGFLTATLRPLSGEPFAELIERAGNYGAPLALLILSAGTNENFLNLFKPINAEIKADKRTLLTLTACLRIAGCLLLVGHGWLNLVEKKGLINQYKTLGFSDPVNIARITGMFEIAGGFIVLLRLYKPLLLILLIWKIISELFYPNYELFEWIERGGSYCILLSLYFIADESKVSVFFQTQNRRELFKKVPDSQANQKANTVQY